jgi:netrin receptor unc-5
MEGRPSAFDFENSPVLQDWVTATDVRVVFHRFHPYHGDDSSQRSPGGSSGGSSGGAAESSNDSNAAAATATATAVSVRDYSFYAAADFAVGGRCKCNGHASRCVQGRDGLLGCDCRHNTAGRDCEKCKPFHFDRPWGRATAKDANECKGESKPFFTFEFSYDQFALPVSVYLEIIMESIKFYLPVSLLVLGLDFSDIKNRPNFCVGKSSLY